MALTDNLAKRFEYPSGRLESLDLLRGIAAASVLFYHSESFLGAQLLPRAYLAVDLFFVLSGFVIAQNYDRRFATGMTVGQFMVQRLIRLYPCYLLALVAGFALASIRMIRDHGYVDVSGLTIAAALNLFILPAVNPLYHSVTLFPFNGASWSIFFELVANLIYGMCFRFLSGPLLALLALLGATGLIVGATMSGSVDLGMRPSDLMFGMPRVLFSFFVGVALRRYLTTSEPARSGNALRISVLSAMLVTLFCAGAFVPKRWSAMADLVVVLLLMPPLVAAASRTTVHGLARRISILAGNSSYPVYLLQTPFFLLFAALVEALLHTKSSTLRPWVGILIIVTVVVVGVIVDKYYELPLRSGIKRAIGNWGRRPLPVPASNADQSSVG
jgi:peptidoglycan/LPS O-acetylase OafA/YrhL